MRLFEAVKDVVSAYEAVTASGLKPNRAKMVCCPFHNDKHPSMKVDKIYYCFGCGAHGDAIDFVANYYGLSLKDAALKLAEDFNISYDNAVRPSFEVRQVKAKKDEERMQAEKIRELCRGLSSLHSYLREKSQSTELPELVGGDFDMSYLQEDVLEKFFVGLKPFIDDFVYVDYLYEYYILDATEEIKKNDYEGILKEVMKIERRHFTEEDNRRSECDATAFGKRLAV